MTVCPQCDEDVRPNEFHWCPEGRMLRAGEPTGERFTPEQMDVILRHISGLQPPPSDPIR